uniref:DDE-type integrase/transposase/recombinase n=1 Tax=Nesterenkonia alkaliphila TaxID=1463631 RepID=UPI0035A22B46
MCTVLTEHGTQIAPSTFYAHQSRGFSLTDRELADAYDANTLHTLWVKNRSLYGRRKLWKAAHRAGLGWGRDRVERLMRITGISGIRRGHRRTVTTTSDQSAPRYPDHIRRRWKHPTRPDQWWVADFTYVWTTAGFCYVSFITDVFSRMILGWRVSTSKQTILVQATLEQALFTRRRTRFQFTAEGLLHHSDAGPQGGFNWSSQHPDLRSVDGTTSRMAERADGTIGHDLPGSTEDQAECRKRVLEGNPEGRVLGRRGGIGGCVIGGRSALVPAGWRYAYDHTRRAWPPVSVIRRA